MLYAIRVLQAGSVVDKKASSPDGTQCLVRVHKRNAKTQHSYIPASTHVTVLVSRLVKA